MPGLSKGRLVRAVRQAGGSAHIARDVGAYTTRRGPPRPGHTLVGTHTVHIERGAHLGDSQQCLLAEHHLGSRRRASAIRSAVAARQWRRRSETGGVGVEGETSTDDSPARPDRGCCNLRTSQPVQQLGP